VLGVLGSGLVGTAVGAVVLAGISGSSVGTDIEPKVGDGSPGTGVNVGAAGLLQQMVPAAQSN
jgi:hypothetical protein